VTAEILESGNVETEATTSPEEKVKNNGEA